MTIKALATALVNIVLGFKNPTNVSNDIEDALLIVGTAHDAGVGGSIIGAALKFIGRASAGIANLESGQAATVATKDGYSLIVVKNGGAAAQSLGL